jgi:5-(carboxyamino)imidazole ribonucleotide mutase
MQPRVAILAESPTAHATLQYTRDMLTQFDVPFDEQLIDDHRANASQLIATLGAAGAMVFIVADTSADPLSAVVAAATTRPVLAVPLDSPTLAPLDALRASTRGGGPPVASLAIGKAGATNAALLAVAILATSDPTLREKLNHFRTKQTEAVLADRLE